METRVVYNQKTGEKTLEIDKRTLPKTIDPPNVKHLRYSRILPPECNMCPYRPQEEGGNGICTKYAKDSVCVIRADFAKLVDKFDGERNSDKVLQFLQAEYENNFEKLAFFEQMEDMSGKLDPEVTKRMNAMTNMAKILNEMRTKRESIEITKTETLSDDMKHQIAQTIKLTRESDNES
jgi:hypothetical protein